MKSGVVDHKYVEISSLAVLNIKEEAICATYLTLILSAWSYELRNKAEQPSKGTFSSLVTFTNIDKIFLH